MTENDQTPYDREHPFSRTHNEVTYDKRLKPNDKVLLGYVFAKPDGWQCKEDVVQREIGMGRKAYYASVNRLIALGYCIRTKSYDHGRKMILWHQEWFRTARAVSSVASGKPDRLPLMVSRDELEIEGAPPPLDDLASDSVVGPESVVTNTDHSRDSLQWSVGLLLQTKQDTEPPAPDQPLEKKSRHKHTDSTADLLCRLSATRCDPSTVLQDQGEEPSRTALMALLAEGTIPPAQQRTNSGSLRTAKSA